MKNYLNDPREKLIDCNIGVTFENDNRNETMYKYFGQVIDLCGLPVEEYMKPITVCVDGIQGGIQGPQGERGADGAQGPQGAQGTDGVQGPQGIYGAQGPQGADGIQGLQGTEGAQGPQGADGAQGPQGAKGADGSKGAQGYQGYQGSDADTISKSLSAAMFNNEIVIASALNDLNERVEAIGNTVIENEEITSAALCDLSQKISSGNTN